MDEIDREAFVVAGFAERTIEHKQEILRLKAIIDNASACSCDPDVGHVCENHYPEWAAHKIRQLEAENAVLRARAVPEVEWVEVTPHVPGMEKAVVGWFVLIVDEVDDGRGFWYIQDKRGGATEKAAYEADKTTAKAVCEAAFLWLVGVK